MAEISPENWQEFQQFKAWQATHGGEVHVDPDPEPAPMPEGNPAQLVADWGELDALASEHEAAADQLRRQQEEVADKLKAFNIYIGGQPSTTIPAARVAPRSTTAVSPPSAPPRVEESLSDLFEPDSAVDEELGPPQVEIDPNDPEATAQIDAATMRQFEASLPVQSPIEGTEDVTNTDRRVSAIRKTAGLDAPAAEAGFQQHIAEQFSAKLPKVRG